jgi:hypothetical protein
MGDKMAGYKAARHVGSLKKNAEQGAFGDAKLSGPCSIEHGEGYKK